MFECDFQFSLGRNYRKWKNKLSKKKLEYIVNYNHNIGTVDRSDMPLSSIKSVKKKKKKKIAKKYKKYHLRSMKNTCANFILCSSLISISRIIRYDQSRINQIQE